MPDVTHRGAQPRSRFGSRLAFALLVGGALGGLFCGQLFLVDRHRPPPNPEGAVLVVEVPEVWIPFQSYRIAPTSDGDAILAELSPRSTGEPPMTLRIEYPGGEVHRLEGPGTPGEVVEEPIDFDFDGDGIADRVEAGLKDGLAHGLVRVSSGADGRVLFEEQDLLEYESGDRAFPLGDLDGDGYGELALAYPRARRTYDLEHVLDHLFETHGWVAVVSGAHLFGDGGSDPERARETGGR